MSQPAGDDEIGSIYHATIDGLYAFVSRRCDGDRDLTEDVTQEAWLRAVRHWNANGIPDNPQAWLTTVARNLLANHFRRAPTDALADTAVTSDDHGDAGERQSIVQRALASLAVPQRLLLQAFHFERQPVADIAAASGLSERAIEGRLRRARQQLRQQIESDPDTDGDVT